MTTEIIIPQNAHGTRVDIFLAENNLLDMVLTRSAVQKLIAQGCILVNNNKLSKNYKLVANDKLVCNIPQAVPSNIEPENISLNIVYEDSDLLVINKHRGLVVHPGAGHFCGTLVNGLLYHCGSTLSGIGGVLRPGIVHRLDKDTSGLMVVAKNDIAHLSLANQLANRTMGRTYNAICLGKLKTNKLKIDLPIGRHLSDRKKMAVIQGTYTKSRNAVTYVEVLEYFKSHTLIAAKLETGRTHQIRVHLSHIGHPILGDPVYSNMPPKYEGQILHAKEIKFIHPTSCKELCFESELPEYFQNAIKTI